MTELAAIALALLALVVGAAWAGRRHADRVASDSGAEEDVTAT